MSDDLTEAAKRLSDTVTMHILAHIPASGGLPDWNGPQPWIAASLADGRSDGNLYPSKAAAVEHQLHRDLYCFLTIPIGGMSVEEATAFLKFSRQMRANGLDIADPDMQIHTPQRPETNSDVIRQLKRGAN